VVYVDAVAGKTFPLPRSTRSWIKGLLFAPHIMVVQQGTTVEFLNSDNVQHNVFWTSIAATRKAGHNLGTWPKGEAAFTFDKAGVVPLFCKCIQKWRDTSLSVQLLFCRNRRQRYYKIKDVPDGSYTLIACMKAARISPSGDCGWRRKVDFTVSKVEHQEKEGSDWRRAIHFAPSFITAFHPLASTKGGLTCSRPKD